MVVPPTLNRAELGFQTFVTATAGTTGTVTVTVAELVSVSAVDEVMVAVFCTGTPLYAQSGEMPAGTDMVICAVPPPPAFSPTPVPRSWAKLTVSVRLFVPPHEYVAFSDSPELEMSTVGATVSGSNAAGMVSTICASWQLTVEQSKPIE